MVEGTRNGTRGIRKKAGGRASCNGERLTGRLKTRGASPLMLLSLMLFAVLCTPLLLRRARVPVLTSSATRK